MAELVSSVARGTDRRMRKRDFAIFADDRGGAMRAAMMCPPVNESPTSLGRSLISVRLAGGNACSINMHSREKFAREEERISSVLRYERSDHCRHYD